jgi:hypothetical protein
MKNSEKTVSAKSGAIWLDCDNLTFMKKAKRSLDTPFSKKQWLDEAISTKQRRLARKYGTPAEFAAACYACCPEFISMTEAKQASEKYNREWEAAGK